MLFAPSFQQAIKTDLKFLEVSTSRPTIPRAVMYEPLDMNGAYNEHLYDSGLTYGT